MEITDLRRPLYGNMTTMPNYILTTSWEKSFVPWDAYNWMVHNWTYGFVLSAFYITLIFIGKKMMENRKPFSLRTALIVWNFTLSAFSFLCFFRIAPHFFHVLFNYGVYNTICDNSLMDKDIVATFWIYMFVLSKAPELGDTAFIILRKTPLIFLHWFHHVTVLLYTWYSCYEITSSARWFVGMNSFIHFLMYAYYAFRAMKYEIPKFVSVILTSLQILQMIGGIYVNYWTYQYLKMGAPCGVTKTNLYWSILMYFSYFYLFCKFFYNAYVRKNDRLKKKKEEGSKSDRTNSDKK